MAMLISLTATSQNIAGQWSGMLKIPGTELRIVFHFEKTTDGYSATLDSPIKARREFLYLSVAVAGDSVSLEIKSISGKFTGKIESETKCQGIFCKWE